MSIGSWSPDSQNQLSDFKYNPDTLKMYIDISQREAFCEIDSLYSAEESSRQSQLMKLPKETWFEIASQFDNDDVVHLIRFFTLIEMKLSEWEAGAESPVVWLVKVLRKRGHPPSKALLIWIKANSSNKFLPNGAIL